MVQGQRPARLQYLQSVSQAGQDRAGVWCGRSFAANAIFQKGPELVEFRVVSDASHIPADVYFPARVGLARERDLEITISPL